MIGTRYLVPVLFGISLASPGCGIGLEVKNFINPGPSLDVVSSLIIGSEAAVIIDLPLAIPQAEALSDWAANLTDKPIVAAFSTHYHPDHYLGAAAFLSRNPHTQFYASSKTTALIENEADEKIKTWKSILGDDMVVDQAAIPTPYDSSFFALPGDEKYPIHLVSPLVGDTIDETLFWIPSISTLIAGDSVYSHTMHLWLADLLTPAMTEAWLSTLELIKTLHPEKIIPGHSLTTKHFGANIDLEHTKKYVTYFKDHIQSKGLDHFTPKQIFTKLNETFPGPLESETSDTSATLLNITSEQFGRGGTRQVHYVDLTSFNATELEPWKLESK